MDTAQWPQEMMFKPMDEILIPLNNNHTSFSNSDDNNRNGNSTTLDKKISAQKPQAINCPRCNSTNTKFCYYNNYSLSQPRYICKACKRYWTEGGSVRNIPVGGVSRKNKKPSSNSLKKLPSSVPPQRHSTNTTTGTHENAKSKQWDNQDLHENQALIHDFKTIYDLIQVPKLENESLEILNGVTSRKCEDNTDNSYMSMPMHNDAESMSMYSSRYTCFPTLGFSLDGIGNGVYESLQGVEESGKSERVLFPFEDLKQVSSTNDHNMGNDIIAQQVDSTEYWNGVLGGGSW